MTTDKRIREALNGYLSRARGDLDTYAQILTTDVTRAVAAERAEWQVELDRKVAEAREDEARLAKQRQNVALAAAGRARESRAEALERLLAALRRIDASTSLSGILAALAQGAAAETSRVALLLVDGDSFRTRENVGFRAGTGPADMRIADAGPLATAVALKQTLTVPPVRDTGESTIPAFMRVSDGHTGLVVPLLVGGDVVAVLYADDDSKPIEKEGARPWAEEIQLLARHAALRLEHVTSVRAIEVLAGTD